MSTLKIRGGMSCDITGLPETLTAERRAYYERRLAELTAEASVDTGDRFDPHVWSSMVGAAVCQYVLDTAEDADADTQGTVQ